MHAERVGALAGARACCRSLQSACWVLILHYELHLILRSLLQLPLFQSDVSSPSYGLLSAPALAWPSPQARLVLLLLSWQAGWVLMWALLAAMVVLAACCCF